MKKIFLVLLVAAVLMQACKKSQVDYRPLCTYTMVNATTDVASARTYAADHLFAWKTLPTTDNVVQYRSAHYGAFAGPNYVRTVSLADTTIVLYSSSKAETFDEGKLNSIFLFGNATAGYDGIFLNNEMAGNYSDSVMGIRFINLSPNSTALNITLSTTPTTNEASNIAYKQKTDFKTYPALQSTAAMVFQLRDAAGTLLASYTLPVTPVSPYTTAGIPFARFKNITLVIKGLQGTTSGTNAFGIFPVPHY